METSSPSSSPVPSRQASDAYPYPEPFDARRYRRYRDRETIRDVEGRPVPATSRPLSVLAAEAADYSRVAARGHVKVRRAGTVDSVGSVANAAQTYDLLTLRPSAYLAGPPRFAL